MPYQLNIEVPFLVGGAGLEPARLSPQDPKSCVSANSTTRPESILALRSLNLERRAKKIHAQTPFQTGSRYSASPSRHGIGATPSSAVILSLDKTE